MIKLSKIRKELEKVLDKLHAIEDMTNYEVKQISKCIDILQELDIDKEYKKLQKESVR